MCTRGPRSKPPSPPGSTRCAGRRALVCYAVKANSNLGILSVFARLGAGFDIVSGGELARVLAAGGRADKVVFSGVGKTRAEMRQALEAGIRCFNVESAAELEHLNAVAGELGVRAPVALRVNPDVDPKTHPYISTGLKGNKFGVAFADALDALPPRRRAAQPAHHRRRLPHRLAAARPCADRRGRAEAARPGRWPRRRRHRARAHRPRRRAGHPLPRRGPAAGRGLPRPLAGGLRRARGRALLRARPLPGRQRRPAAHPHRVPQAGRDQELRDRRCGHERSRPSGALRRLARGGRGRPRERDRSRRPTTSSARSARAATSSPASAAWRWPRATCWRSCRRAPTA